jgi:alpha-beta hydrolase superfamily lysophospholipase
MVTRGQEKHRGGCAKVVRATSGIVGLVTLADLHPGMRVRPARAATAAVVLVLHGGKENSLEPSEARDRAGLRMRPFERALHHQGAGRGVAVWALRYRVRGWNGPEQSPVHDARWALEEVRRQHGPVPVVLVGHSMGGRAAVRVLDDPSVTALVALAPWLPHEPVDGAAGKAVLVVHGDTDTVTSPAQTRAWADQARAAGARVEYVGMRGTGHAMLRRSRLWTGLAVGFSLRSLSLDPRLPRAARTVLARIEAGEHTLAV